MVDRIQSAGALFEAVQAGNLFPDCKTFVDAIPKVDPQTLLNRYQQLSQQPDFDLRAFVLTHFKMPGEATRVTARPETDLHEFLNQMWTALARPADSPRDHDSLIALPYPYVVPGGRFREIYYWDSYFTQLGLMAGGHTDQVRALIDNFAFLINCYGFVPNGNRTYYLSRSQPPFFALMVEHLAAASQDSSLYSLYLPAMAREYAFWMAGSEYLNEKQAFRRVVSVPGGVLNRYWDEETVPRPESYREDMALAQNTSRDSPDLFRDLRAACESGWDFSARWLDDPQDLASIRTTQRVPIDLNALMARVESILARSYGLIGDKTKQDHFQMASRQRLNLIQSLFFDPNRGYFMDLGLPDLTPTRVPSLAGMFPLYLGLAQPGQARLCAEYVENHFLKAGGYVTTALETGQQWDSPNGWAPLQWAVYRGLRNYGFHQRAERAARAWIQNVQTVFGLTGRMLEKYDVVQVGRIASGGEYQVQDGFGWTNGVYQALVQDLGDSS